MNEISGKRLLPVHGLVAGMAGIDVDDVPFRAFGIWGRAQHAWVARGIGRRTILRTVLPIGGSVALHST